MKLMIHHNSVCNIILHKQILLTQDGKWSSAVSRLWVSLCHSEPWLCAVTHHCTSHSELVSLSVTPPSVSPGRERASGAPVSAGTTSVLPGWGFLLPAPGSGPRGLSGALQPGLGSWGGIAVSGRAADVESYSRNLRDTHLQVHGDGWVQCWDQSLLTGKTSVSCGNCSLKILTWRINYWDFYTFIKNYFPPFYTVGFIHLMVIFIWAP